MIKVFSRFNLKRKLTSCLNRDHSYSTSPFLETPSISNWIEISSVLQKFSSKGFEVSILIISSCKKNKPGIKMPETKIWKLPITVTKISEIEKEIERIKSIDRKNFFPFIKFQIF